MGNLKKKKEKALFMVNGPKMVGFSWLKTFSYSWKPWFIARYLRKYGLLLSLIFCYAFAFVSTSIFLYMIRLGKIVLAGED